MADLGVMFTPQGRPTPLLISRWRAKGALQGLQLTELVTKNGRATPFLRSLWRQAFPERAALPMEPVVTPAGLFTQAMLDVWG